MKTIPATETNRCTCTSPLFWLAWGEKKRKKASAGIFAKLWGMLGGSK